MEPRKITIIQTKEQRKSVIVTAATTLAELKSDLRANGINYNDMTFYEGTSKIELKNDASILPHDVPYKGTITNELVFMLTNTNKKIRSGAVAMSRTEVYSAIKSMGLQEACKQKFGKNFTQCSTTNLISLIQLSSKPKPTPKPEVKSETKEEPKEVKQEEPVNTPEVSTPVAPTNDGGECIDAVARAAISRLVEILGYNDVIEDYEKEEVLNILGGAVTVNTTSSEKYSPKSASPYSDDEIDDMFAGMGIK